MVCALSLPLLTLPLPLANLTLLLDGLELCTGLTGVGGSEISVSPDSSASESVVFDERDDLAVFV